MASIIDTNLLSQVGFVVKDIETAKRKYAAFFGVPVPDHFDGGKFDVTGTVFEGKPAPYANCWMAFFDVGEHTQIELIQPNGERSAWQDYLDEHGEGMHHLAFNVTNMDEKIKACEAFGMTCIQRGKYGNAMGEYAYMDARKDLKCYVELLENY